MSQTMPRSSLRDVDAAKMQLLMGSSSASNFFYALIVFDGIFKFVWSDSPVTAEKPDRDAIIVGVHACYLLMAVGALVACKIIRDDLMTDVWARLNVPIAPLPTAWKAIPVVIAVGILWFIIRLRPFIQLKEVVFQMAFTAVLIVAVSILTRNREDAVMLDRLNHPSVSSGAHSE